MKQTVRISGLLYTEEAYVIFQQVSWLACHRVMALSSHAGRNDVIRPPSPLTVTGSLRIFP